jgi:hypothetical protein
MNIDENNKLIAEYMGFLVTDYGYIVPPNTHIDDYDYAEFHASDLSYDFDWNSLMSVVQEIEKNNSSIVLSSSIKTTYENVVDFIKKVK